MIPEEDDMRKKMKEATVAELYPGFDKEVEWAMLNDKLKGKNKRILSVSYLKVAAMVLLMVCAGGYGWYTLSIDKEGRANTAIVVVPADTIPGKNEPVVEQLAHQNVMPPAPKRPMTRVMSNAHTPATPPEQAIYRTLTATEPICNATRCALEICIYQTKKCLGDKPTEISDCRTLEPEQSAQLKYTPPEAHGKGCKITVDEVRITRVSTGETIVINADTQNATPEEVLNCLTGDASCNMLAGMFESDCGNQPQPKKLKIDSRDGDVIIR